MLFLSLLWVRVGFYGLLRVFMCCAMGVHVLFICCAWVSMAPRGVPSEPSVLPVVSRDRCPFDGVCRSVERSGVVLQALRLVCPSVPVFSRVTAPGVVALFMLFSPVLAVGSAYYVGAVGEYFFATVG